MVYDNDNNLELELSLRCPWARHLNSSQVGWDTLGRIIVWIITLPSCCSKWECFLQQLSKSLKKYAQDFCVCAPHPAQTNDVFVLLIWDFIQWPLEINRDKAHATSKHQSRLRCRWTLCPFITHALNLLAVISLATGEGICGHLTSFSLSLLWQMVKHIIFSQSLALMPLLNVLYRT